jgi:hypothetical protein
MKKYLISTSIIILATCTLHAQDVKFGIRGGVNMANMSTVKSTPMSDGYSSRLAPAWGLFTELQLNPVISLRLGVEYSGLGGKKDGMQPLPTQRLITETGSGMGMGMTEQQQMALGALMYGMPQYNLNGLPQYYYVNMESTTKFDYVMIPFLVQAGLDLGQTPWRVYVNAGPTVSFFLSGKTVAGGSGKMYADDSGTVSLWHALPPQVQSFVLNEIPGIDKTLGDPVTFGTTNITGEMKSTNFGVMGNAGIRYQRGNSFFFIEAGINYHFSTVQDSDANGSNRLSAVSFMAGYAFKLF